MPNYSTILPMTVGELKKALEDFDNKAFFYFQDWDDIDTNTFVCIHSVHKIKIPNDNDVVLTSKHLYFGKKDKKKNKKEDKK